MEPIPSGPVAVSPERRVRLLVGQIFRLPSFEDGSIQAEPDEPREHRFEAQYWDTPDLRLARWGADLSHEKGGGWTLRLPLASSPLQFPGLAREVPEAALRLLPALLRCAKPRSTVTLSTWRREMPLDGLELYDDDIAVLRHGRVVTRFRELEVAGPGDKVDAAVEELRAAGAVEVDPTSTVRRALGAASQAPEVRPQPSSSNPTAGELLSAAMASSLRTLILNDPMLRLGGDPEAVHDARVATRRMRSHLQTFRPVLDAGLVEGTREELRWLAGELGAVRDLEVLGGRLRESAAVLPADDRDQAEALLATLDAEERAARDRMRAAIDTPRYLKLLDQLISAAQQPPLLDEATRPAAQVVPGLARKSWRRLRRAREALPEQPEDASLHRIRILAKRTRYTAEAGTSVAPKAARYAKVAASLQTVLGELQDSVTAQHWLREHASGRVAWVAGELAGIERGRAEQVRLTWGETWRRLDSKELRGWMR